MFFQISTHQKILVALAVFFTVFAGAFRFLVAPFLLQIPSDFTYEADLTSVDNFFDTTKGEYLGQQYSQAQFKYSTVSSTRTGMEIKNSFSVYSNDGEEIINIQRTYGIDPATGAHITELGDEAREGYLFAPKNLEPGESFTYWHVNYNGPAHMSYVGRSKLYGLEVYEYQTNYEGVTIDQTKDLDHLEGVPEKYGIVLEPQLTLWVEPITGTLVNYEDSTTAYYYDITTGEKISPWNHFSNTFTEDSVKSKAIEAAANKSFDRLVTNFIPLAFLFLAGLCVFCFFVKEHKKKRNQPHGHWVIHSFSVLFPIVLVFLCWYLLVTNINKNNELEFQNRITEIEDAILRKIDIATTSLEGIQGLFQASSGVTREEWSTYVAQLDLEEKYPGIKAVGYNPVVLDADKSDHEAQIRSEGFPDYAIRPEGIREYYTPILYVEPSDERNLQLLGSDSSTVDIRKDALNSSRDSGSAVLSGKLYFSTSNPDDKQVPASVFYIPIYKRNMPLNTVEERREAISGYAFASFWAEDFINGLFGTSPLGVNFAVYDGTTVKPEALIYEYVEEESPGKKIRTSTETIYVASHPWTITFEGLAEFKSSNSQLWLIRISIWFALLLSGLHIFIYLSLARSRVAWMARSSVWNALNARRNK